MNKESILELQKIDSNCNDCKFMIRDINKHKKSVEFHHKMQLDYFTTIRNKMYEKVKEHTKKGDLDKAAFVKTEADRMVFVFDKSKARINFGFCQKLSKQVTFLPNVLQLETQQCFEHRREINN